MSLLDVGIAISRKLKLDTYEPSALAIALLTYVGCGIVTKQNSDEVLTLMGRLVSKGSVSAQIAGKGGSDIAVTTYILSYIHLKDVLLSACNTSNERLSEVIRIVSPVIDPWKFYKDTVRLFGFSDSYYPSVLRSIRKILWTIESELGIDVKSLSKDDRRQGGHQYIALIDKLFTEEV